MQAGAYYCYRHPGDHAAAVGKPAVTGTFEFNLNIGGGNCQVPVMVTATGDGGGGGAITGEYYYKLTIDGVTYSQDVTETNGISYNVSDFSSCNSTVNWLPCSACRITTTFRKSLLHFGNSIASR